MDGTRNGEWIVDERDEQVLLVDESDQVLSATGKLDAHVTGSLHRAFSVFLFRPDGTLLLQRRAASKYHSPGLWANSCCGHPRPFEDTVAAGERRLREEIGIRARLESGFCTRYTAELDNGLVENELVHVLFGVSDAQPHLNPDEACETHAIALNALEADLTDRPAHYAIWIRRYFATHAHDIASWRDRLTMPPIAPKNRSPGAKNKIADRPKPGI